MGGNPGSCGARRGQGRAGGAGEAEPGTLPRPPGEDLQWVPTLAEPRSAMGSAPPATSEKGAAPGGPRLAPWVKGGFHRHEAAHAAPARPEFSGF